MSTPEDPTLPGAAEADAAAFEAVFRAWYAPLVRLAEGMLRDRAVAEEIVQDVMLEYWRRRDRLTTDGSPQAYLFQATRNRALNQVRHSRVRQRAEPRVSAEAPTPPAADRDAAERELAEAVRAAVATLPPRCREVFELSRVRGMRYAEIAQLLDITVKAVEANMARALRSLREQLASWLPATGRSGLPPDA